MDIEWDVQTLHYRVFAQPAQAAALSALTTDSCKDKHVLTHHGFRSGKNCFHMAFKSFLGKCFGWSRRSSYCDKTIKGPASKTSLLGQVESYIDFDLLCQDHCAESTTGWEKKESGGKPSDRGNTAHSREVNMEKESASLYFSGRTYSGLVSKSY